MSLDLILVGATGGVVGTTTVLAARAVASTVTKLAHATKVSRRYTSVSDHAAQHLFTPDVAPLIAPVAEATAHARLRERQLAEFADQLAGDDPVLRERLLRFEGGLS